MNKEAVQEELRRSKRIILLDTVTLKKVVESLYVGMEACISRINLIINE